MSRTGEGSRSGIMTSSRMPQRNWLRNIQVGGGHGRLTVEDPLSKSSEKPCIFSQLSGDFLRHRSKSVPTWNKPMVPNTV